MLTYRDFRIGFIEIFRDCFGLHRYTVYNAVRGRCAAAAIEIQIVGFVCKHVYRVGVFVRDFARESFAARGRCRYRAACALHRSGNRCVPVYKRSIQHVVFAIH